MTTYLICAHYNLNNGDRAVLEATLRLLRNHDPESKIIVSAFAPEVFEDSRVDEVVPWALKPVRGLSKYALSAFERSQWNNPVLKRLLNKEFLAAVEQADVVLGSGGHHLTDLLGDDTFLSLALNFGVPAKFGKRLVMLPQTIGPLLRPTPEKQEIIRTILRNSELVLARDGQSVALAEELGVPAAVHPCPDLVYSLDAHSAANASHGRRVGIALYCNYATEEGKSIQRQVMGALAEAAVAYLDRGFEVVIIPMEVEGTAADDRPYARELIKRVKDLKPAHAGGVCIQEPNDPGIAATVDAFAACDLVFACKTHSTVFAVVGRTPVVAIAYQEKTVEFMREIGLEDFAVYDRDVSGSLLKRLGDRAIAEVEAIQSSERQYASRAAAKADRVFEEICHG